MHVTATPNQLEVEAGQAANLLVTITNTSDIIEAYRAQVFGVDPDWVVVTPERVSLFPGEIEQLEVTVTLPADYPASSRPLGINVTTESDATRFAIAQVTLEVLPSTRPSVTIDPVLVTGGKEAVFGIVVANQGNAVMPARAIGTDPEDLAEFRFEPDEVLVPPGRTQVIRAVVSGGQNWFGQPRARVFELGVDTGEQVESLATFIQRPRISRWMLSLFGLALAAGVFFLVLQTTFNRVVDEAQVDSNLLARALDTDPASVARIPVDPAVVSGEVVSASTGSGVSGVQADLFSAGSTEVPVASAATDGGGAFTFPQLNGGTYVLRFSGAGFETVWYEGATNPADATRITVDDGETLTLDEFRLGARPGSVAGRVVSDDPVGAVVTLTVPGQLDPTTPAQVAQVEASADGSFVFDEVPSPAEYRLEVTKPGFATEARAVVLRPAQVLEGVEVVLRSGDGVISGVVTAGGAPLGGATVEATDGTLTISTATLTDGDVGAFALRNLPTPGRYTVTVSRDGFAPESRSVFLSTGETSSGFSVNLTDAIGSVRGTAFIDGVGPSGGITVTITGSDIERRTTTISQGQVGTYQFGQLPIPGTYTVSFSRDGLVSQVRLVDLDAQLARIDVEGVDATLIRNSATVRGIVVDSQGSPLPRATVVLSDATSDITFESADEPNLGEFEFFDVAPGAYTLTASRPGSTPTVELVNVLANQTPDPYRLELGDQAGLTGQVRQILPDEPDPVPFEGVTVRIFLPPAFVGTSSGSFASMQTDADGNFTFEGLEAPADYIIAVFLTETAVDPLASLAIPTQPGQTVPVDPIDVVGP